MTPAFLLLVTVFAIWPDFVSPCGGGGKPEPPKEPKKDCYCGLAKRGPTAKIAGGKETGVNEYPWQALVISKRGMDRNGNCKDGRFPCGGSVIGDQWVLTAAHCLEMKCGLTTAQVEVVLGEHNTLFEDGAESIQMDVTDIIINEDYDPNWKIKGIIPYNDIALLRLRSEIDFVSHPHIRPICLPDPVDGSKDKYVNYTATATGWGSTRIDGPTSFHLREVDVRVESDSECKQDLPRISDFRYILCAKGRNGKGVCRGDSGGPLITKKSSHSGTEAGENYELIGVTSFLMKPFMMPATCVDQSQAYVRVTAQIDWIKDKTKNSWKTCDRT